MQLLEIKKKTAEVKLKLLKIELNKKLESLNTQID